jgi:hypothetical protein
MIWHRTVLYVNIHVLVEHPASISKADWIGSKLMLKLEIHSVLKMETASVLPYKLRDDETHKTTILRLSNVGTSKLK